VTRKKNELPITAKGKEGKRAGRQGSHAKWKYYIVKD
jgi:hypothetical protein